MRRIIILILLSLFLFEPIKLQGVRSYNLIQFNQLKYCASRFIRKITPLSAPYVSKIRRDKYELHVSSAISQSIQFIRSDKDIEKYISEGKLVSVSKDKGFRIHKLSHSEPVLSEKAKSILLQIGNEFSKNTDGQYFTVTSLTRSNESQKKLSKVNLNASKGISSHCYGASFDISYVRFNGRKGNNQVLQKELENLLIKFQEENKVYVIYERQNSCYHITVI